MQLIEDITRFIEDMPRIIEGLPDVIERMAHGFMAMPDTERWAINYGLFLFGAIVAAFVKHRRRVMRRQQYFAFMALLVLAVVAIQAIWFFVLEARVGGYLWVLAAINVVSMLLFGWYSYRLAKARSLDIIGNENHAVFAVLPVLNLLLFFRKSKSDVSAVQSDTPPPQIGGPGGVTGFTALIAAVVLAVFISNRLDDRPILLAPGHPMESVAKLKSLLWTEDLSKVLQLIAQHTPHSVYVDEATALLHQKASGQMLIRTYVIDTADYPSHTDELLQAGLFRAAVEHQICSYPHLLLLLKEGTLIREIFDDPDGNRLAHYDITQRSCGF